MILSASYLFDDHDCEMLPRPGRMELACYCLGGAVWRRLLWPVRQSWFACYCHDVILSASCLFDDRDCEMLNGQ